MKKEHKHKGKRKKVELKIAKEASCLHILRFETYKCITPLKITLTIKMLMHGLRS